MRSFVAIEIPDDIRQGLAGLAGGVPGARWLPPDQIHLTLRFVGEVNGTQIPDLTAALEAVHVAPFELELAGIGTFGHREARVLWAGVAPQPALTTLQQKVENAVQRAGLEPNGRKFTPHVTLARLNHAKKAKLGEFISLHGLYASRSFTVDRFVLFSSFLSHNGAIHTPEAVFPLNGG